MFTDSIHISPEDDLLDSRDLFNRYCHLESRHRQFSQQIGTWGLSKEEHKELRSLRRMQKLVRVDEDRSFEWRTGVPVVSDAYFTEYALAFAEDNRLAPPHKRNRHESIAYAPAGGSDQRG